MRTGNNEDHSRGIRNSSSLSVAAPAFNEGPGIRALINEWLRYLDVAPWVSSYEIVIADDGSTDSTAEIVETIGTEGKPVKLVRLVRNRGAGVALREAIKATEMDWVLLIDSDGQFDIEDSALLHEALVQTGADLAIGTRRAKEDRVALRLGSRASAALSAHALGRKDLDLNSALKLGRGDLMRSLNLEARHLNYSADVALKASESGARIVGVSVGHGSRVAGESSATLTRDGFARLVFTFYSLIRSFAIKRGVLDVKE